MILVKSSALLLIDRFVPYTVESGCTHVSRGMVGRVVQVSPEPVLLIATNEVLTAAQGCVYMEGCERFDKFRSGESMYETSMDIMSGERCRVSR